MVIQFTADFLEIIANQGQLQVIQPSVVTDPVIKRHLGGKTDQLYLFLMSCLHSGRAFTDVIAVFPVLFGKRNRGLIRSILTSWSPEN
jgi:hypothetical protein